MGTAKPLQVSAVEVNMGAATARAVGDGARDCLHGFLRSISEIVLVQAAVGVAGG